MKKIHQLVLGVGFLALAVVVSIAMGQVSMRPVTADASVGPVNDFGKSQPAAPGDEWIRTYGNQYSDTGEAIIKTSDGGYIAAGSFGLAASSGADFYVVKTDDKGDASWQKTYGTANHEYLNSIVEVSDGYVLAGFTENTTLEDFLVIKIDKSGDIVWQKTFGASDRREFGHRIAKTSDGGFVVIGGDAPSGSNGTTRLWLIKLDANGNKQWDKSYGNIRGTEDIETGYIEETSYGFILGTTTYVKKGPDFWILKLDTNGNILKDVIVGKPSPSHEILTDIHQTSDGGYITAGYTQDISLNALTSGWAVKLDSNLNVVWQKAYGLVNTPKYSAQQSFQSAREVFDGFVFAGTIYLPSATMGDNNYDYWLVKTDFNGDTGYDVNYWQKTYGTAQNDELRYMSLTADGFVMAGFTQKLPKTSSDYDMLLIKIKGAGSFACLVRTTLGLQATVTSALTSTALSDVASTTIPAINGPASQANGNGVMANLCN